LPDYSKQIPVRAAAIGVGKFLIAQTFIEFGNVVAI
jgi:hypothetical protein